MKKYISLVLVLITVTMFQGCADKAMTNTFFDVNSEYDEEGAVNSIKQTRIMTINPLASVEEVGQVCFLDPKRGTETAVYLDINVDSKKVVKDYIPEDYNSTEKRDALMKIRDNLLKLDRATIALVEKNHELLNLKLYKEAKELNTSRYNSVEEVNKQIEDMKIADTELKKEISANLLQDLNSSLKEFRKDIKRTSEKIEDLQCNITDLSNNMNGLYNSLLKELNQSNAIIFRWSVEKEKSWGAGLGELISGNKTTKKSLSGFVLASGIKTERLILSDGVVDSMDSEISEFFKPSTGIITYTVSARDMIFVNKNDISTMFSMDMNASYDDFTGNSTAILQKIDKLKLHIAASSVENGLSGGYLSSPKVTKEYVTLPNCKLNSCSAKERTCGYDNNSSVFFAVYTKLSELNRLFKD